MCKGKNDSSRGPSWYDLERERSGNGRQTILLADLGYHNFGSLSLPSVIISYWNDTYISRMKDLVLNKFIIHGALISLSWFWYHRMVYTYNFLPRKNIESNVHETNTQGSIFIQ